MSGGVDSSVALILLKKSGWQPIGVSLKLPVWKNSKNCLPRTFLCRGLQENVCCTKKSFNIAKKVCKKLNIPHHIIDVQEDFIEIVIKYFTRELKSGRTPNPCVICNQKLKFKKLFEAAKEFGASYVATGHYARIMNHELRIMNYRLQTAKDSEKDQTYNLSFLPSKWLKNLVFPLGNYTKKEVYKIAAKNGLKFFEKIKQSQDFCFIANKSLPEFYEKEIGGKPGFIKNENGKVLGKHNGLAYYTIGQRKGLLMPNGPHFVKQINEKKNEIIVTKNEYDLFQKEIFLKFYNFLVSVPKSKISVTAKVRYRQPLSSATLFPPKNGKMKIIFKTSQRAVTPGQFCVFYKNQVCLGGGII